MQCPEVGEAASRLFQFFARASPLGKPSGKQPNDQKCDYMETQPLEQLAQCPLTARCIDQIKSRQHVRQNK